MRSLSIILVLLVIISSCSKKVLPPPIINTNDSVRTIIKYRIVKVKDSVFLEVPPQSAERTARDSTSHLETDYATSDARIMPDGSLSHNLKNKPQKKPVETEKEIIYNDTTIYKERKVEVPVPVERELTWWEQTSIKWFSYVLIGLIITIIILFRNPLRKLINLIRRYI